MTYIHPERNQKNILNFILTGLIFTCLLGVFWLIALYNNVVNLSHNLATAKTQLDAVGAQNTSLNNQVVAAMGDVTSGDLAVAGGLVQDNHPAYFTINQPSTQQSWPIASQQ